MLCRCRKMTADSGDSNRHLAIRTRGGSHKTEEFGLVETCDIAEHVVVSLLFNGRTAASQIRTAGHGAASLQVQTGKHRLPRGHKSTMQSSLPGVPDRCLAHPQSPARPWSGRRESNPRMQLGKLRWHRRKFLRAAAHALRLGQGSQRAWSASESAGTAELARSLKTRLWRPRCGLRRVPVMVSPPFPLRQAAQSAEQNRSKNSRLRKKRKLNQYGPVAQPDRAAVS